MRLGGAWQAMHPLAMASAPAGINFYWFIGAGFAFLAWMVALALEAREKDGAAGKFLLGWIAFCIGGAISAPVISSRSMLAAVPAVVMLMIRDIYALLRPGLRLPVMAPLMAGTLWLAFSLVQADMRSAWAPVDLLDVAGKELARADMKGILASDWGFQYQGMDRGYLLPARDPDSFAPGRGLVITEVAPMHMIKPAGMKIRQWLVLYSEAPELPLRTMNPRTSAGFYGNGWLPYSFSREPVEKVVIMRLTGTGDKDQK